MFVDSKALQLLLIFVVEHSKGVLFEQAPGIPRKDKSNFFCLSLMFPTNRLECLSVAKFRRLV
jgi:hypothetical protein